MAAEHRDKPIFMGKGHCHLSRAPRLLPSNRHAKKSRESHVVQPEPHVRFEPLNDCQQVCQCFVGHARELRAFSNPSQPQLTHNEEC
jgi:hypothetical protein